jgi:hypothetical protein
MWHIELYVCFIQLCHVTYRVVCLFYTTLSCDISSCMFVLYNSVMWHIELYVCFIRLCHVTHTTRYVTWQSCIKQTYNSICHMTESYKTNIQLDMSHDRVVQNKHTTRYVTWQSCIKYVCFIQLCHVTYRVVCLFYTTLSCDISSCMFVLYDSLLRHRYSTFVLFIFRYVTRLSSHYFDVDDKMKIFIVWLATRKHEQLFRRSFC